MKSIIIILFVSVMAFNVRAQVPCATAQRAQSGAFISALGTAAGVNLAPSASSIPGWTGTGSGTVLAYNTRTYISDNTNIQTFAQNVTNVNLKGTGGVITLTLGIGNGSPNGGGVTRFNISYGGTLYAFVSTSFGTGTAATVTYQNGASGNLSTIPINFSQNTLTVYLPAAVPNSGVLQVQFQPVSQTSGGAADDFDVYGAGILACPIVYSGTVLGDGNGLTDNAINGTGTNAGGGLQVALYDALGNVVPGTTTNVAANGNFSISYINYSGAGGAYTVRLVNLPSSYVSTGEKLASEPVSDGVVDGRTSPMLTNTALSTNADQPSIVFGINARPETYNVTVTKAGGPVPLTFSTLTPLQGSDPEQQPAQGAWSGTGKSVTITSLPTNGFQLVYNGTPVSANQTIVNYDPTLLVIQPTAATPNGTWNTSFGYASVDANGTADLTPATYTVNFTSGLPVTFGDQMSATINEKNQLLVNWSTLTEKNSDHFDVEISANGVDFTMVGTVKSKAANGMSDTVLDYEYVMPLNESMTLTMVSVLGIGLFILLVLNRKNRFIMGLSLLAGVLLFGISCRKNGKNETVDVNGKRFVRVVHTDKEGHKEYSKIVQVVRP